MCWIIAICNNQFEHCSYQENGSQHRDFVQLPYCIILSIGSQGFLTLGSVGFFAFAELTHHFTSLHINDIPVILCPYAVSMSHTTCCCQIVVDSAILTSCVIIDSIHDVIPLSDGLVEQLAQPDLLACCDRPATPTCCQLLDIPLDPVSTATFIHMSENTLQLPMVALHRVFGVACFSDLLCDIVFPVQQLMKSGLAIRVREIDLAYGIVNADDSVRHTFLACGSSDSSIHNKPPYNVKVLLGEWVKKLMLLHRITGRAVYRRSPRTYAQRCLPIPRPRPVSLSASHMRPPILHKGCPLLRPVDS